MPRGGDLQIWREAREFGIVRNRLSHERIDDGKAAAQYSLSFERADGAKPHGRPYDPRGHAVSGSQLRKLFAEAHRLPDGDMVRADRV